MRMFGLHHDPVGAVIGLIDEAHATLHTEDLADLLLRVRPLLDELLSANASQAREWWDDGMASPAVRVYLRPIHVAVARVVSVYAEPGRRGLVARLLHGYLDEVAARPRGSAVAGGV